QRKIFSHVSLLLDGPSTRFWFSSGEPVGIRWWRMNPVGTPFSPVGRRTEQVLAARARPPSNATPPLEEHLLRPRALSSKALGPGRRRAARQWLPRMSAHAARTARAAATSRNQGKVTGTRLCPAGEAFRVKHSHPTCCTRH